MTSASSVLCLAPHSVGFSCTLPACRIEHHIRHPHYLNIPSGREVQDALHDAEKELAHALADRAKAEIAIHNARLARKHFRSTRGRFCIDMDS